MLSTIPLIDAQGNINLHIRSDLSVDVKPGATLGSLATRTLVFEIPRRGIRHELVVHPTEPTWRIISIPASDLRAVLNGDPFVLVDRTGGSSKVWWEGSFKRRGQ